MTHEEMKEAAEIILAAIDGKIIQIKIHQQWEDNDHPDFQFLTFKYRIKPELEEAWVNYYEGIITAAHKDKDSAIRCCRPDGKTIHMREVMDESGE